MLKIILMTNKNPNRSAVMKLAWIKRLYLFRRRCIGPRNMTSVSTETTVCSLLQTVISGPET